MICLDSYPVKTTLGLLLQDKTTKQNIIWATDTYATLGTFFEDDCPIMAEAITGINRDLLQPRIAKALSEQADRTKKHAEVFTPAWICNQMNNYCDAEWFGRENVFNRQNGMAWIVNGHRIRFPDGKTWQDYVLSTRLEITCGEAPFIVSRYDAATGEPIDVKRRIGQLDRKLRVDKLCWSFTMSLLQIVLTRFLYKMSREHIAIKTSLS